jgi:ABC-type sulfate transport system permease component
LIHLPLVLPPVVVGYLLLIGLGRRGIIGEKLYDWLSRPSGCRKADCQLRQCQRLSG